MIKQGARTQDQRKSALTPTLAAVLVSLVAASCPAEDRLFILNAQRDVATVVDASSGNLAEIELSNGLGGNRVTMSVDGRRAYVWSGFGHVSVIDTATRSPVSKRESIRDRVVTYPRGTSDPPRYGTVGVLGDDGRLIDAVASYDRYVTAFDPTSQRLYHGWQENKVLLAIDPRTGAVTGRLVLEDTPTRLVFSADASRLFVIHSHSITAIDTDANEATKPLTINGGIDDLALTADGTLGFATKRGSDLLTVIDLSHWRAIDYVRIDAGHTDVAVSNDSRRLYYAAAGSLSIIDIATMAPAGTIIGGGGGEILLAAGETRAFVIGSGLALYDLQRNELIATMPLDSYPSYALTREGSELYVVGYRHGFYSSGSTLQIIAAQSGEVLETFVNDPPENIQTAPNGRIYVTQPASGVVRILDPQTAGTVAVIPPLELGDDKSWSPVDVTFTSQPDLAFVSYGAPWSRWEDERSGAIGVYRVDDHALEEVAVWGPNYDESPFFSDLTRPSHIAVKPDGSEAYVVTESPALAVVDMNSLSLTHVIDIAVEGDWISDLAISPDGSKVYATRWYDPIDVDGQSLVVIDTDTKEVSQTVPLRGTGSYGIAIPPGGSRAFVATTLQDTEARFGPIEHLVSVVDTVSDSVASVLSLPMVTDAFSSASYIAASPDGDTVYATLWAKGAAVAIDAHTNALLGTIAAGDLPTRLAVSSAIAFAPLATSSPTPTPTPVTAPTEIPILSHLDVPALTLDETSVAYWYADRSTTVALDGTPVAIVADPASMSGYVVGVSTWEAGPDTLETRVWRVRDGRAEAVASLILGAAPESAAISSDGRLLYIASRLLSSSPYEHAGYGYDTVVTVLDVASGAWRTTATLEGLPCSVTAAPDGQVQVVTNRPSWRANEYAIKREEALVTLFSAATHGPVERSVIAGSCYGASVSQDGARLAIVGDDIAHRSRHLTIVDLRDGSVNEIPVPELSPSESLLWSPDSDIVYVSSDPYLIGVDATTAAIGPLLDLSPGSFAASTPPPGVLSYLSTSDGVVVFDRLLQRVIGKARSLHGRVTVLCTDCVPPSQPPKGVAIDSLPSIPPAFFPLPPTDLPPARGRDWIQVDDAAANPGDRLELRVTLYSQPAAGGMSAELWLPPGVAFAPWVDGKPDCELTPDIDKFEDSTIAYLPAGCTPGIDCSGAFLDVISVWRLNLWYTLPHTIFRCRVDVDESLAPGTYPLQVKATSASALDWDDSRVYWPVPAFDGTFTVGGGAPTPTAVLPTSSPVTTPPLPATPTATPTPSQVPGSASPTNTATATSEPTPTATFAPRAALLIDTVTGEPGSSLTVVVRLGGSSPNVAGIQNDLEIDSRLVIRRCRVAPEIEKSGVFGFYSLDGEPSQSMCPSGRRCDRLRAIIFSYENPTAIPVGAVLYTCTGEIPASTPPGTYTLRASGVVASDEAGNRIEAEVSNGIVEVKSPALDGVTNRGDQSRGMRATDGCNMRQTRRSSAVALLHLGTLIALVVLRRRTATIKPALQARGRSWAKINSPRQSYPSG